MKILDRYGNVVFDTVAAKVATKEGTIKEAMEAAVKMGRSLSGAHLYNQQLRDLKVPGAMLAGADLRESNLAGADLSGADLSKSDLRMAILLGANLRGTDLSGANLRFAVLADADLAGANLDGADITATDRERELIGQGVGTGYIIVKKRRKAG
ncbi:MAG TPA: pentapeptide repeat-containing protein [bacterium]|nr:pentapeptide repeat-containing protein [bacterium]